MEQFIEGAARAIYPPPSTDASSWRPKNEAWCTLHPGPRGLWAKADNPEWARHVDAGARHTAS